MKHLRDFIFVFFISAPIFSMFGQISKGGMPLSRSQKYMHLAKGNINKHQLQNIDNNAEKGRAEKVSEECNTCEKNYYGKIIDVDIDIKKKGEKIELDNGNVWLYKIQSASAYGLQLYFDKFNLPGGATLFIFNDDNTMALGGFTEANNNKSGMFATQIIKGNSVTLEYFEPEEVNYEGELHINKVVHDFMNFYGQLLSGYYSDAGGSESCEKNVKCAEGNGWGNEISSVVMSLYEDVPNHLTRICSGTLINNLNQDGKPYYLNAGHCFENPPFVPLNTIVFLFNYEAMVCNSDGSDAIITHSLTGCELKVNGFGTGTGSVDFTLVELNDSPPLSWNICYAGWDITATPNKPLAGIHHPRGDVKKISTVIDDGLPVNEITTNDEWFITFTGPGGVESGSSGSPLFNSDKRSIGCLRGGGVDCDALYPGSKGSGDYTKFSNILNFTGVKQYLDPNNTGVTFVNTYCPTPVNADLCKQRNGTSRKFNWFF